MTWKAGILLAGAALAPAAATLADAPGPPGGRALGAGIVRLADADRSGTVESWEWDAFVIRLDPDGDGRIPERELARAVGGSGWPAAESKPDDPRRAFFLRVFDRDGSGAIETSDLDDIFLSLDRDGSGDLSVEEVPALARPRRVRAPRR